MTKQDVNDRITRNIERLDDEGLEYVANNIEHLAGETVYSTLSEVEKRRIDETIASLDQGEAVAGRKSLRPCASVSAERSRAHEDLSVLANGRARTQRPDRFLVELIKRRAGSER